MPDSLHAELTTLLHDDPAPEVRAEAARALAVIHDIAAVDELVAALGDESEGVRRAATLALGRIRDERVVSALIDLLVSRPELWQEIAAALATAGEPAAVERLSGLLDSDSVEARRGAVRAIAAITARTASDEGPLFEYTDEEGHRHPLF